jgi:hypothetical protein
VKFINPLTPELTLGLLMSYICGVSKTFGEWYQKTNKTEVTNKLTLLAFRIIAILHNTRLATFIKLLETVRKCHFRNRSQNRCHMFLDCRRMALGVRRILCAIHSDIVCVSTRTTETVYSLQLVSGECGITLGTVWAVVLVGKGDYDWWKRL